LHIRYMPFIQLQFRRDTAANWIATNPVLASGEMGIELDTHYFKIGDGTSDWQVLQYGGLEGPTGATGPGGGGGGDSSTGSTGATGSVVYYTFDGGSPSSIFIDGPAFNCGGPSNTGTFGESGEYTGTNIVMQLRHGNAADWTSSNPILAIGEMGYEINTRQFKIGDGETEWLSLPYGGLVGATGSTGGGGGGGGDSSTGSTGATGSVVYYTFDGGSPSSIFVDGPAFNCGGPSNTGTFGESGEYTGTNIVMQLRHGNSADWTSSNPVLAIGEMGYEIDSGQFKIGDGIADWLNLP
jgi:hypothetical protein